MRKTVGALSDVPHPDQAWLDLDRLASVEVTSEDPNFPVESAFASEGPGWRASQGGPQQIRLVFDRPQSLRRIQLRFQDAQDERTQEFTLRWLPAGDDAPREIARQQWNFSPAGSTTEVEDYAVELDGVLILELKIRPDLRRTDAVATLASMRLG